MRKVLIASLGAVAFMAAGLFPAAAQFPPLVAIADPNDPSIATVTGEETGIGPLAKPTHKWTFHYDCAKKKWVLVSIEGMNPENWKVGRLFESGGAPQGAKTAIDDPNRAFNPTTGQNFVRDKEDWVDVKTGQKIVTPKLCPEIEEKKTTGGKAGHGTASSKRTTERKTGRKKDDSGESAGGGSSTGMSIGIGIGVGGGRGREHERDRDKPR